jgi:hypothetical protein
MANLTITQRPLGSGSIGDILSGCQTDLTEPRAQARAPQYQAKGVLASRCKHDPHDQRRWPVNSGRQERCARIKKQRPRDALGKGEPLSSVEDAEKSGVSPGPGHRGVDTPRSPFARKVPKSTSGNEKEIGMKPLGDGISSCKRTKNQNSKNQNRRTIGNWPLALGFWSSKSRHSHRSRA